ncbi:BTB domain transcription factor [Aspergillus heteromorphus CBS 117.55]|uniref:BTB domain transcription factor n=1 Tax=Aspergillus heteromorphus CBS 117.55 TaxID=1448321 RepID=A0A317X270_9EURO|nr:BTB domain transcription factor [Aspergillus heteromorphus CBS 117.55]PWY92666.1 BTB domain transcription factor [Aspergillus heteromorphus CBS 117.55]
MATRTSTRQAAQKAKEAIAAAPDVKSRGPAGSKRKESVDKGPAPKRGKKDDKENQEATEGMTPEKPDVQPVEKPEQHAEKEAEKTPDDELEKPVEKTTEEAEKQPESKPDGKSEDAETKVEEKPEGTEEKHEEKPTAEAEAEAGVKTSHEREEKVASNVLEKGIIYFFYRPRVNVTDPQNVNEIARSFLVLRPTPIGATLDHEGSVKLGTKCRLMMLPKKKFPTSGKERDMGFVEKAGQSLKSLQESFIAGETYDTATQGERSVPEARPYAEGVYAITSSKRTSHLAYVLTIPKTIGTIQEDFGLHSRGSWVVQSKNPKHPGPPHAQIKQEPEYPDSVREKFGDYRWVPLQPEFIDYSNAQFLMIGAATDSLGKAATVEDGDEEANEEQPGEELEKLEKDNEERIEALRGDDTIYEDLGLDAKNYPAVPTTWHGH